MKVFDNLLWVTKDPYIIRDATMIDALNVYKSNFSKQDNARLIIGVKKKKVPSDLVVIYSKRYRSKRGVSFHVAWQRAYQKCERLSDKLEYDCRLVRPRIGHLYLRIPRKLDK